MQEKFIIKGKQKLDGTLSVSGTKNEALKVIPACLLTQEKCVAKNIPDIVDVRAMLDILKDIGADVKKIEDHHFEITCGKSITNKLPEAKVAAQRASIMLVGPLLARFGEVSFPHPGGCVIGKRPIDLFLEFYKQMGVSIAVHDSHYQMSVDKLQGIDYIFPRVSVTGTESLILAGCLAEGETIIRNAAMEPEIEALAEILNDAGAKIIGAGTPTISIKGVAKLNGFNAVMLPDRIECGTFAIMGVATNSHLKIENCRPDHLGILWSHLEKMGAKFKLSEDSVEILPTDKPLKAQDIHTHEYPGFVTDLQAPFTVLLTQTTGMSLVHETIYEGRLFYVDALNTMGGKIIMCDPHRVVFDGPMHLYGRKVVSPDIRAGIALVIAAMIAEGDSEISNVHLIDRGYENIEERLKAVGAEIERVSIC
ncbi:UDP-N-acetylglucosamine 1-carboxyvinyltransferase [Patescibacteria group bacterium]